MLGFFSTLDSKGILREWVEIFDWLLGSPLFLNWEAPDVTALTNFIKKSEDVTDKTLAMLSPKHIKFQKTTTRPLFIQMLIENERGKSPARNILRHVRNGIAHGSIKYRNSKIELTDKDKETGQQTAFIVISAKCLFEWKSEYDKIEKEVKKRKKKPQK